MKASKVLLLSITALFIAMLIIPYDAAGESGNDVVNIETYLHFRIEFQDGDSLKIDAEITSSAHPISVFLIKGEKSFEDWEESEIVDIGSLMNGSSSVNRMSSFQVISGFSKENVTEFSSSIDIGEHDTYFLVIALHRDEDMDVDDLLQRVTEVTYEVDWEVESKELNYTLLAVAVVSFILGSIFLIIYIISWKRAKDAAASEEGPDTNITRDERGSSPRGRRSPPLR